MKKRVAIISMIVVQLACESVLRAQKEPSETIIGCFATQAQMIAAFEQQYQEKLQGAIHFTRNEEKVREQPYLIKWEKKPKDKVSFEWRVYYYKRRCSANRRF